MKLALFDFDGTLTRRDSFMPFVRHIVGTPRFAAGLLRCAGPLLGYAAGRIENDVAKQRLIAHFLRGRRIDEVRRFGATYAAQVLPRLVRPATLAAVRRHREAGDVCVLVSASLDVYLDPWAFANGFVAVLCSGLAADAGGTVTGRIEPRNCFGPEKERRIRQWLAGRAPAHITAYGDSRGDREMMALAHTRHWLRGKAHR